MSIDATRIQAEHAHPMELKNDMATQTDTRMVEMRDVCTRTVWELETVVATRTCSSTVPHVTGGTTRSCLRLLNPEALAKYRQTTPPSTMLGGASLTTTSPSLTGSTTRHDENSQKKQGRSRGGRRVCDAGELSSATRHPFCQHTRGHRPRPLV